MAVKKPIYITEKGYTQEMDAELDSFEINSIELTAGGHLQLADGYIAIGSAVQLKDDGYVSFANGSFYINPDGSTVSASGALQIGSDGELTVGTGAETAVIDADGYMTLSAIETTATSGYAYATANDVFHVDAATGDVKIAGLASMLGGMEAANLKITGDQSGRLYMVDADGYVSDEEKLTFDGYSLSVDGNISAVDGYLAGDLTVAGEATLASAIVSDLTSGRVVLAGLDGVLEDSADLTFDGTNLSIGAGSDSIVLDGSTGDASFDGSLTVGGAADLNGALDVAGQVDLAASEVATSIRGTLSVAETATFNGLADFNAGVTANSIKIDGDTAQRLYIVDADGYISDEEKLTFDGSKLSVDGDGYFSGALEVAGEASLHGNMSFIANKSITFADNSGSIAGLADLGLGADGYSAVNKNYVDAAVAAIGLDASNTSSSSLVAAESISIGDPIFIDSNGKAARGDTTSTLNEKSWVFGVAAAAAAADASVEVVRDGIAAGVLAGLGMSAGAKVWLAAGGGLVATKPESGRIILLGFALSSSDLLVDVRDYGLIIS